MAVQERTRGAQGSPRAGAPRGRRAQAPGHLVCPAPLGAPFPVAGGCPAGPWEVPGVGTREGGDLRTCRGPWTGLAQAETHPGGSSPPAPTRASSWLGDAVLSAHPSLGPLPGLGPRAPSGPGGGCCQTSQRWVGAPRGARSLNPVPGRPAPRLFTCGLWPVPPPGGPSLWNAAPPVPGVRPPLWRVALGRVAGC